MLLHTNAKGNKRIGLGRTVCVCFLNNLDSMLMVGVVVYRWWGELTAVGWLLLGSDPALFSLLLLLQGLAATMTIEMKELEPTLGSSPL